MSSHTNSRSISETDRRRIAVIGAGIAGLTAARFLQDRGRVVRVFDKARGVGGRTSIRRREPFVFDFGTQYFTIRTEALADRVADWQARGVVEEWQGRIVYLDGDEISAARESRRFVGVPGMNAMARDLALGLDLVLRTPIRQVEYDGASWHLVAESGEEFGAFGTLILTLPSPQARALLGREAELFDRTAAVAWHICHAVMLGFGQRLDTEFDAAFVEGATLSWIARNNSKPARGSVESWILHSTPEWSHKRFEQGETMSKAELLRSLLDVPGFAHAGPVFSELHRWRFAKPATPLDCEALLDTERRLIVGGDWCVGQRFEDAYSSGLKAAELCLQL